MKQEILQAFLDGNLEEYIEKRERQINRKWFWFVVFICFIFIGFFCTNQPEEKKVYPKADFNALKEAAKTQAD